jgi:hypothetical protein
MPPGMLPFLIPGPPPLPCLPSAVLLEPGQEDLVPFLAEHQVRVVASMPCYSAGGQQRQRRVMLLLCSGQGSRRCSALGWQGAPWSAGFSWLGGEQGGTSLRAATSVFLLMLLDAWLPVCRECEQAARQRGV